MLHHLSIAVTDLEPSASFYDAVLGALGFVRTWSDETAVGYGPPGSGDTFAIKRSESAVADPPARFHVAFVAHDRDAVAAFHATGLAHGGRDNGGPGLRPEYGPDYFAAYVLDPDGYNVEAVINEPGAGSDGPPDQP